MHATDRPSLPVAARRLWGLGWVKGESVRLSAINPPELGCCAQTRLTAHPAPRGSVHHRAVDPACTGDPTVGQPMSAMQLSDDDADRQAKEGRHE